MNQVSVCMATYNGAHFIQRQLISILDQLSANDEVVISDDGSTDETIQLINALADSRIRIFNNQLRHGPIGNFENALRQASGEFIFLADQDDVWLPGKISTICTLLTQYDLVLADCEVVNGGGKLLYPSFFKHRGSRPGFWPNLLKNSYVGCCMAFRRDVLSYALPFPAQIHMHDWWIGLLVEAKGTVVFYAEPLIQYVRHGGNASPTGETGYGMIKKLSNRFFMLTNVVKRLMM